MEIRYKSVVVPVVKGTQGTQGTQGSKGSPDKYLLVKDRKSGDWTFPGGGCGYVKSRERDQDKYKMCALEEFKEETREAFGGHQGQLKYIGQFVSLKRSHNEKIDDKRKGKLGQVRQLYLVYKLSLKIREEKFEASKEEFKKRLKYPKYQDKKYQETINAGLFTMEEIKSGPLDKSGKGLWGRMKKALPIIEESLVQDQCKWNQCKWNQCEWDRCKQDTRKRLSSQLKTANRWGKSKRPGW